MGTQIWKHGFKNLSPNTDILHTELNYFPGFVTYKTNSILSKIYRQAFTRLKVGNYAMGAY